MGEVMTEARRAWAKLEAIRDQLTADERLRERLRDLLRRGLAMLNEDEATTPEEWKDWLWDTHSTLRAHIASAHKTRTAAT